MTKRKWRGLAVAAVVVLAMVAVVVLLARRQGKATLTAVVLQVSKGQRGLYSLMLYTTQTENDTGDLGYASLSDETTIRGEDGQALDPMQLQPGQLVEITFSGLVQESYPPSYAGVSKVAVLGLAEEGLYAQAQAHRQEVDDWFDDIRSRLGDASMVAQLPE